MSRAGLNLLACAAALALLPAAAWGQTFKGKAERPQLAPIFSPSVDKAPIMLQPAQALKQPIQPNLPINVRQAPADNANGGPEINCRLPVKQIGRIALNDAFATINDRSIEVQYNNPADPEPLLIGKIIRLDDTGTADGGSRQMSGLVVFHSGQMLGRLTETPATSLSDSLSGVAPTQIVLPAEEMIFSRDGSMTGQIVGIDKSTVTLKDRTAVKTIPFDSISYVRSPRAFVFTLKGRPTPDFKRTEVQSVAFQPTLAAVPLDDVVILGQPSDSISDDDEAPLGEPIPASVTRMRQLQRGNFDPRPLPTWP